MTCWRRLVRWGLTHRLRGMPMAGVNAAKDDVELINKQTKLLENRLEMSLIKLNEAVGKNKLLRDDIDNLRRERCVFDQARHHCGGRHRWCVEASLLTASLLLCVAHPQVYKKLERELHEKKREMASVIDVSNIAYEARDQVRVAGGGCRVALLASVVKPYLTNSLRAAATQAQNEIAALRAQSDKEQAIFDAEYREVRAPPPRAPDASCNQRTRCAWRLSPLCAPPRSLGGSSRTTAERESRRSERRRKRFTSTGSRRTRSAKRLGAAAARDA